jgi:hypothetical protein
MPKNENIQRNLGRPVIDSKAPARGWLLRRKLLLTAFVLGGMAVFSLLTAIQQTSRYDSAFEGRRSAAAAVRPVDFVLSSQSGTTIERPRR